MAWGRIYKKGKKGYTDIIYPDGTRKRKKVGTRGNVAKKILDDKLAKMTLEGEGIF